MKKHKEKGLPLGNLIGVWFCIFAIINMLIFTLIEGMGLNVDISIIITSMVIATIITIGLNIKINKECS